MEARNSKVHIANFLMTINLTTIVESFADNQLTDALKHLATDSSTDPKVKKKLLFVLASWNQQFKDDPSMSYVAGLYKQVKPERPRSVDPNHISQLEAERKKREEEYDRKRREEREAKEDAKRRAKEDKEAEKRKKEEDARRAKARANRKPFIFEQASMLISLSW
jgi:LAS seventeen-binding protein 5